MVSGRRIAPDSTDYWNYGIGRLGRAWPDYLVYPFTWQSVVQITTTVTNRHDELDEVVCDLLSSLTNCSLGNGLISQVG